MKVKLRLTICTVCLILASSSFGTQVERILENLHIVAKVPDSENQSASMHISKSEVISKGVGKEGYIISLQLLVYSDQEVRFSLSVDGKTKSYSGELKVTELSPDTPGIAHGENSYIILPENSKEQIIVCSFAVPYLWTGHGNIDLTVAINAVDPHGRIFDSHEKTIFIPALPPMQFPER